MPFRFAVVCEAPADFRTATALAERSILERVDWLDDSHLAGCPLWCEVEVGRRYLLWKEIPDLARDAGIVVRGHFVGRPGEADARAALRSLRFLKLRMGSLDGVLLIRDDDRDASRRDGLEQARDADSGSEGRIVIGLAHTNRECWILAGFDPVDAREEALIDELRATLGFDPRTSPDRLNERRGGEIRNVKEVLGRLTRDDPGREEICWMTASLGTLRERGGKTGLADFLDEVETRLVPLFGGIPPEGRRAGS